MQKRVKCYCNALFDKNANKTSKQFQFTLNLTYNIIFVFPFLSGKGNSKERDDDT